MYENTTKIQTSSKKGGKEENENKKKRQRENALQPRKQWLTSDDWGLRKRDQFAHIRTVSFLLRSSHLLVNWTCCLLPLTECSCQARVQCHRKQADLQSVSTDSLQGLAESESRVRPALNILNCTIILLIQSFTHTKHAIVYTNYIII